MDRNITNQNVQSVAFYGVGEQRQNVMNATT